MAPHSLLLIVRLGLLQCLHIHLLCYHPCEHIIIISLLYLWLITRRPHTPLLLHNLLALRSIVIRLKPVQLRNLLLNLLLSIIRLDPFILLLLLGFTSLNHVLSLWYLLIKVNVLLWMSGFDCFALVLGYRWDLGDWLLLLDGLLLLWVMSICELLVLHLS